MQLEHPFVQLPVRFDVARLVEEVSKFDDGDWIEHPEGFEGNSALPLISFEGDPTDDRIQGPMRPTALLRRSPYLQQVLASFRSTLGRTRLMRLDAGAQVSEHADIHDYWYRRIRIHVPIVTSTDVAFYCGYERVHMPAGEAWVFDTWRRHNVVNRGSTARIHLVCDTVGSSHFWGLFQRGQPHVRSKPALDVAPLAFDPKARSMLHTETRTRAPVMPPAEMERRVGELSASVSGSGAYELRCRLWDLARDWRDTWSRFGEAGHLAYRALLRGCDDAIAAYAGRCALPNRVDGVRAVRSLILEPALEVEPRSLGSVKQSTPASGGVWQRYYSRPVFLVCSPRSGSSLVFETLSRIPDLWSIGRESHEVIEALPPLSIAWRGFASNRLDAGDCTPEIANALAERFYARLRDRDGRVPHDDGRRLRLLEKTPKNSIRVPFLAAASSDAHFLFLHREPREVVSSMLDGWRSGAFVTYPHLPGWRGLPWSFLLVPGWRDVAGAPVAEVVARQWATATEILLDDLSALPADRVHVVRYEDFVSQPIEETERICAWAGWDWDPPARMALPLSRTTLTPPRPDKWKRNARELAAVESILAPTRRRVDRFLDGRRCAA